MPMKREMIKVILVLNDERYRNILKTLLKKLKHIEIIGEVGNANELIKLCTIYYCDIILIEINDPIVETIHLIKLIQRKCAEIKIIGLLNLDWEDYIEKVMEIGIKVLVFKPNAKTEVEFAINAIINNKHFYCEEIADYLAIKKVSKNNNIKIVTNRENEILQLLAKGLSRKEIIQILPICLKTLGDHIINLRDKSFTKTDIGLINWAKNNGLIF
jgi:DNA-binding NarL/FixJ family response regulator